jgi:hypothetical protein
MKRLLQRILGALAVCTVAIAHAAPPPPEATLRQDLQDARWPADIVREAGRYLTSYPQGPSAVGARADLDRARNTKRLLERSDIRLYRADFVSEGAQAPVLEDVRKAALADKDAAFRLAHMHRDGESGLKADLGRLQYSAALGNGPGSYELALYYRKDNQPALAAPYEARAEELGFKAPAALDNVRK